MPLPHNVALDVPLRKADRFWGFSRPDSERGRYGNLTVTLDALSHEERQTIMARRSHPALPILEAPPRAVELLEPRRERWLPTYTDWEITLRCDLPCLHCGSRAGAERPNELSTAECLDRVEDAIHERCLDRCRIRARRRSDGSLRAAVPHETDVACLVDQPGRSRRRCARRPYPSRRARHGDSERAHTKLDAVARPGSKMGERLRPRHSLWNSTEVRGSSSTKAASRGGAERASTTGGFVSRVRDGRGTGLTAGWTPMVEMNEAVELRQRPQPPTLNVSQGLRKRGTGPAHQARLVAGLGLSSPLSPHKAVHSCRS